MDISVVIATHNRASALRETLDAMALQRCDGLAWELIVSDNGSTDVTREVISAFRNKLRIDPIYLPESGKSKALNAGIERSRGKLLVFTDDDVTPCNTWLESLHDAARHRPAEGLFCGPIIPAFPVAIPDWLKVHPFRVVAFAEFRPESDSEGFLPPEVVPFGPNFAVAAEIAKKLSFRLDLGPSVANGPLLCDDVDYARAAQKYGRFYYLPQAAVRHRIAQTQLSVEWLLNRAFNFGRSVALWLAPTHRCVAPVWAARQSKLGKFDSALMVNYFLGQLVECEKNPQYYADVRAHLRHVLSMLRPVGSEDLSSSARALISVKLCDIWPDD